MSLKINANKREVLQVILDQQRLYIEESLGSVMVRGEVIVHFSKDTPIQGPIDLVFEGIQRFRPWKEIMKGSSVGSSIETKLQVIELSLIPPNTRGIMPGGVQRFPFEFPIPTSLPASVEISNRLEIFYRMRATLQRSFPNQDDLTRSIHPAAWVEWALPLKKKYTACSPIRIVRAMESIFSDSAFTNNTTTHLQDVPRDSNHEDQTELQSQTNPTHQMLLPWNRRHLDHYSSSFDQQHDQLAFSLAGRTSTNFHHPLYDLSDVQGVRYNMSVDRTAVALGTSLGIELMIEPTMADAVVKSIVVKITESRAYSMKVPAGHTRKTMVPETKDCSESLKMVLKWACGYQMNEEDRVYGSKPCSMTKKSEQFVYRRTENSKGLFYFDPPHPGSSKSFLGKTTDQKQSTITPEDHLNKPAFPSAASDAFSNANMVDLKELNQPVKLGEYFGGRFVLPVPDCSNMLHPSMTHASIKITHWMHLVVTIECNGVDFDLNLETPARMLDCRLVAVDDEGQTVLPPPPSYVPGDSRSYHENNWSVSTFWEQREPITASSEWGSCIPCPCEYRRNKQTSPQKDKRVSPDREVRKSSDSNNSSCPPSLLPEWGPPPCYSEN